MKSSLAAAKRIVRIVFGFTLLVLGALMLVLPGPGWLTIALGLAVLATEYVWARRLLDRLKKTATDVKSRVSRSSSSRHRTGDREAR